MTLDSDHSYPETRSIHSYSGPAFNGPRLSDFYKRTEFAPKPPISDYGEFLLEQIALKRVNPVRLGDDWDFLSLEALASQLAGHQIDGTKPLFEQLWAALIDFDSILSLIHPNLPAEAIQDFLYSTQVKEHLYAIAERLRPFYVGQIPPNKLHAYPQAVYRIRQRLVPYIQFLRAYLTAADGSEMPAPAALAPGMSQPAHGVAIPPVAALVAEAELRSQEPNHAPAPELPNPATKSARKKRGPDSDDPGHIRVAEILANHPQWPTDPKGACALLANPPDGGPVPDISRSWRRTHRIAGYADAFEAIGNEGIRKHIERRLEIGNNLRRGNCRKLSETVGISK